MKRVAVILSLCALLLPAAAWASEIVLTNHNGTVNVTDAGIVSNGMQLLGYNSFTAGKGQSLGSVFFSTGAFTAAAGCTQSPLCNGTFAGGASSKFIVTGKGAWLKTLTGTTNSKVTLFSGSFVGPVQWTMTGQQGANNFTFTLSGTIRGQLWDGRTVTGTTTQHITLFKNQWRIDQQGNTGLGTSVFVPEPGTLGLLGTGLIGVAGTLRRKLFGA